MYLEWRAATKYRPGKCQPRTHALLGQGRMPLSCQECHLVRKDDTIVRTIPLTPFPSLQRRTAPMPKLRGDSFSVYLPRLAGEVSRSGAESPSGPLPCQCLAPHLDLISMSCWMSLLNMGFDQQEEQSHLVTGSSDSVLSVMSSPTGPQQTLGCTSHRHWPIKSGMPPKAHFLLLAPPQKNSVLGIPASRTYPQILSLKKLKSPGKSRLLFSLPVPCKGPSLFPRAQ